MRRLIRMPRLDAFDVQHVHVGVEVGLVDDVVAASAIAMNADGRDAITHAAPPNFVHSGCAWVLPAGD